MFDSYKDLSDEDQEFVELLSDFWKISKRQFNNDDMHEIVTGFLQLEMIAPAKIIALAIRHVLTNQDAQAIMLTTYLHDILTDAQRIAHNERETKKQPDTGN